MKNMKVKKIISLVLCVAFVVGIVLNPLASYATNEQKSNVEYEEYSETTEIKYSSFRGETKTSPTKAGYVFAGWYKKDGDAYEALRVAEADEVTSAYAKFVTDDVLGVKIQLTAGTTTGNQKTSLRVVSSVDSLNYRSVGFYVTINGRTLLCSSTTVYSTLHAIVDGKKTPCYPKELFSQISDKFVTHRIDNIPNAAFTTAIKVKPTWTTLDGTEVIAAEREVTIEENLFTDARDYELYTAVQDGERVANTQGMIYSLTADGFTDDVTITSGDTDFSSNATIDNGRVTISAEGLKKLGVGTHKLNISNSAGKSVTVTINVYTAILSNTQDIIDFSKYVDKDDAARTYGGSFKLANNITLGETIIQAKGVWDEYANGFTGVFDGYGYTIDGGMYGPGGLLGVIGTSGEVKNLSIVNAGIGLDDNADYESYGWYAGILAGTIKGKVTDVLLELCYRQRGWYTNDGGADAATLALSLDGAKLTRVVVTQGECPAGKEEAYQQCLAYWAVNTTMEDVYFEHYAKGIQEGSRAYLLYDSGQTGSVVGITTDDNLDWLTNKDNFGGIWDLTGNTIKFATSSAQTVLSGEDVKEADYELYRSIISDKRAENPEGILYDLSSEGFADKAVVTSEGTDMSKFATIQNGKVNISADLIKSLGIGSHDLQISNGADKNITVTINVYTSLLSKAQDIKDFSKYVDKNSTAKTYSGSFKLANNITLGDTRIQAEGVWDGYENGFTGVFDGYGYTIDGGLYGPGGMFGVIGTGGEVKNLSIVNAGIGLDDNADYEQHGNWYCGTLAGTIKGKVTDVLVELCYRQRGWYTGDGGADAATLALSLDGATLTRVVVTQGECPAGKEEAYQQCIAYWSVNTTMNDVYFEHYAKTLSEGSRAYLLYDSGQTGSVKGITTDDNLEWLANKDNFGGIWDLTGNVVKFATNADPTILSAEDTVIDYELYHAIISDKRAENPLGIIYDLSAEGFADTVVVTSGDTDLTKHTSITGGQITIGGAGLKKLGIGSHELNISNGVDKSVTVTVNVYTSLLSTARDIKDFSKYVEKDANAKTYGGSFKLIDNITLGDTRIQAEGIWDGYENGFTGVFDGYGYTIDGGLYGPGGLFGVIGAGGEVKNLSIVNAGIGLDDHADYEQHGNWYCGTLAGTIKGKVTDVLVELCYRQRGWYTGDGGADAATLALSLDGATLTRVVVTQGECPAGKEEAYQQCIAYWSVNTTMNDVYFEHYAKTLSEGSRAYLLYDSGQTGSVVGITTDDNLDWLTNKDNFGDIWDLTGSTIKFKTK